MKKLAFLFLIYDKINLEELWNLFFNNIDKEKYNIYIHYKYNNKLKYFEKYKLNNCIETTYGHISVVKAQDVLINEALKDINNQHFILLSGACIPFKNFDHIYNYLNINKSYFNTAPNNQCLPRAQNALKYISKKYLHKASQWCILNRIHSNFLINNNDYIKWFSKVYASDELCYITALMKNNFINDLILTNYQSNNATTFTNWTNVNYKYMYQAKCGLKNYDNISQEELLYLINSKCLFGRKFNQLCYDSLNIDFYLNAIQTNI